MLPPSLPRRDEMVPLLRRAASIPGLPASVRKPCSQLTSTLTSAMTVMGSGARTCLKCITQKKNHVFVTSTLDFRVGF